MKKLDRITFWICIALILFITMALKPLSNLDEIWNFNVARGISNGLVPYKDISMVSTPLLGFIMAIPMKFLGQELYVSRILTVIFFIIVFALVHIIIRLLDVKKEIAYFTVILLAFTSLSFLGLNYNILALIFALMIVLFEILYTKNNKWRKLAVDFCIGGFAGLAFCSKQSVGLFICIAVIFGLFFYVDAKSDLKKTILRMGVRAVGIMIPIMIFFIYLAANQAFQAFFDYAVKGVTTFSNKIPYGCLLESKYMGIQVLSILLPIVIVIAILINIYKKIKNKENNIFYILTLYSVVMFSVVFPISDGEHFLVAMTIPIILCVFSLNEYIRKYVKFDFKYVLEFINIFSMLFVFVVTLWLEYSNVEELGKISKYKFQKHYDYIYISDEFNKTITEIDKYITTNEKNVYIIDASSAVYMIPIDRYNKDFDMFLLGNIGAGGEDAQIDRIKNEDAVYLIMKDENRVNWQNPNKVREYIMENLELVETKEPFDVYKHKVSNEEK